MSDIIIKEIDQTEEIPIEEIDQWLNLEPIEIRDEYYDEIFLPIILRNNKKKEHKLIDLKRNVRINHMITLVSTYNPVIISTRYFEPEKVLLIYTDQSKKYLDKVLNDIKEANYDCEIISKKVERTDVLEIYNVIKETYREWGSPEDVVVDYTGGTKPMSVAAAMAGYILGGKFIYLGTESYKKNPKPGTEIFEELPNPYSSFGDLEIKKALEYFKNCDYTNAFEILERVFKVLDENKGYYNETKILMNLALCYKNWDELNFSVAYSKIGELNKDLESSQAIVLYDLKDKLSNQEKVLKRLAEDEINRSFTRILKDKNVIIPLIFSVFSNAKRRVIQEKYDMASLLIYRMLEMIMQRRMIKNNINVSEFDFEIECNDKKDFLGKITEYAKYVYGNFNSGNFTKGKVRFMNGYLILAALKDKLYAAKKNENELKEFLKSLNSRVTARNQSIYAHGFIKITREEYNKFEEIAMEILKDFCNCEDISFDLLTNLYDFINPVESKYLNEYYKI